ncbi:AAA family ATPase [Anaerolineales bacterium HSG24]|nr:AAA family ATPase [Anaerolineales bacterium HSG24]
MELKSLIYHDIVWNWQLNKVDFTDLTLLVGASGVGKTLIIEAIVDLQHVVMGQNRAGLSWEVEFSIDGRAYHWLGQFAETSHTAVTEILNEQLFIEEKLWLDRTTSNHKFNNNHQSLLYLLRNDTEIDSIYKHFRYVMYNTWPSQTHVFELSKRDVQADEYPTVQEIRHIAEDNTLLKLWFAYTNQLPVFQQIREDFMEIFPTVQDVLVMKTEQSPHNCIEFSIKEAHVTNWIPGERVSAGMFKVLMFITDMYLAPDDAVILLDEFENSLGVNCIEIVNEMVLKRRRLQYIFTSHHPYIINDIPMPCWRIVTRKGNTVTVNHPDDYKLGKSKHTAFKQLLQLDEFEDGLTR